MISLSPHVLAKTIRMASGNQRISPSEVVGDEAKDRLDTKKGAPCTSSIGSTKEKENGSGAKKESMDEKKEDRKESSSPTSSGSFSENLAREERLLHQKLSHRDKILRGQTQEFAVNESK